MFNAEISAKLLRSAKGFGRVLNKIRILSVEQGSLKAEFNVTENETNEHGILHNGFSITAFDVLTGVGLETTYSSGVHFVSIQMNFSFYQSAKLGDEIMIETKTIRKGGSMSFLEAEFRNKETNELLVKGSHIAYLLTRRKTD